MLKALNAIALVGCIALAIVGAVADQLVLLIVAWALGGAGVVLYLLSRRASGPPIGPTN
jgi:hypothetical protein